MEDKELKYFAANDAGGNFDDADFAIGENDWVNMENCRTGSTDKGFTGTVESIGGTLLISTPQPSVTFLEIGSAEEVERNRFCYFKFNTTGTNHKIVCYENGIEYDVLLSSQVTGGLNFSKNSIIHSASIVDGKLYWVDGTTNQPRKINIDAAIKGNNPSYVTNQVAYTFPINFSEITLIKPPPPLSPNIQKLADTGFLNNFIGNSSFMFAFQYVWYDNETTVLGTYSPSSRINKPTDTENYIQVTMDGVEVIPQTVRIVRLIVRFGNSNDAFVVKTWDKNVTAQATEIANQNNGTQALTFDFYNNITGEVIPSKPINLVLKPFDVVPLYSGTMSVADERLFLGDNTVGYDAPTTTSLTVTATSSAISAGSLVKQLWGVRLSWATPDKGYAAWYVFLTEVVPVGWYEVTSTVLTNSSTTPPAPGAPPVTSAFSGLAFKGASQSEVIDTIRIAQGAAGATIVNDFSSTSNNLTITGVTVSTYDIFKTQSVFKYGMVFYDFAMRKCAVVWFDGMQFSIAARNYAFSTGVRVANWSVSNANALNEIPDWAYYYTPVRTLNLTTRNFIDSFTNSAKYATKDANGVYQFTNNTFVTGTIGIALNTAALIKSGLGYTFNEGDICVLIKSDDTTSTLPVIDQTGNYIIVKAKDIGDLSTAKFVFEIYTPYIQAEQEPFYEVGQMYRVLSPTTSARRYETLSDIFVPDAYVLTRNYSTETYLAEAMSPNDIYWQTWYNDGGKVNFISQLGQVQKKQNFAFSNTFIPQTGVNGLSTFDVLNDKNLPIQMGTLRKLQIASKVQDEEGIIMLAIGEKQTASLYIGEVQQYDVNSATNLVVSDRVIGTVNVLKGNFGTVNPEGVVEYRGTVFIPDANNKVWVQYASNGLFPISEYKMVRFWNLFFTQFLSMTVAEIEALGGRPFIFATVDPYHKELLISIPKLLSTPPKGYLPDYPSTIYPFDIWDGTGKTIVYQLGFNGSQPRWQGSYSFNPEGFVTLLNKLYSFRQGHLYLHNQPINQNEYYGVQYKSRVMFISNKVPTVPKVYNNFNVQSNIVPTFVYFYNDYPYQQSSDLVDYSFNQLEGIWYSTILRNKLVPTATGFTTDGLLTGEKMRNVAMKILLEFSPTTTQLDLKFVTIGFIISKGNN